MVAPTTEILTLTSQDQTNQMPADALEALSL